MVRLADGSRKNLNSLPGAFVFSVNYQEFYAISLLGVAGCFAVNAVHSIEQYS